MLEWNNKAAVAVLDVPFCLFGLETFSFSDRMELAMHKKALLPATSGFSSDSNCDHFTHWVLFDQSHRELMSAH